MDIEELRKRRRGKESPFILRLTDGRTITVPEPLAMALGGATVAVGDNKGRVHVLHASEIAAIEELVASP